MCYFIILHVNFVQSETYNNTFITYVEDNILRQHVNKTEPEHVGVVDLPTKSDKAGRKL